MPSDFRIPESLRHFSGMVTFLAYDAAGNLLSDGNCSYTWDGEERLASAACPGSATTTYIYDAEGRRVAKAVGTTITEEYVYSQAGQVVSAYGPYPSMTWLRDEIYAGGRHVATYANGTTYFHHADQVGSERVRTGVNGAAVENCTNLPFGDGLSCTGTDPSPYHFGQLERDTESTNDHAWFRYYGSSLGRWLSPDPLGGEVTNPQSLNRYAYVLNNPTNFIDPLGLDKVCVTSLVGDFFSGGCTFTDGGGGGFSGGGSGFGGPGGCADVYIDGFFAGNTCGSSPLGSGFGGDRGGGSVGNAGSTPGGTQPQTPTPAQAATQSCQEHGQIAFNIPFTKTPVTISLSAGAFFSYSTTNDIGLTFPPSAGVSLDITAGAPEGPNIPVQVGAGEHASVGTFLTPQGPHGFSLSIPLSPPFGGPVTISPTVANGCGLKAGGW